MMRDSPQRFRSIANEHRERRQVHRDPADDPLLDRLAADCRLLDHENKPRALSIGNNHCARRKQIWDNYRFRQRRLTGIVLVLMRHRSSPSRAPLNLCDGIVTQRLTFRNSHPRAEQNCEQSYRVAA